MTALMLCTAGIHIAHAQEDSTKSPLDRSQFVSDASFFFAQYDPGKREHSPQSMAAAGQAWVAALSEPLRSRGALPLTNVERREWTNLPPQPNAGGVRLGELNASQRIAAANLIAELFSESGYQKICQIMAGDDQLLAGGRPRQGIGTVDFSIMVFGEPSATEPWAFQLDGHHLGLNVAVDRDSYSLSPSFIGCQPEEFEVAGRKYRPFAGEVDDAFDLIASLSGEQRTQAVLSSRRGNLQTGPGADGKIPEALGAPGSKFDSAQRAKLMKLIDNWIEFMPPVHAERRRKQLETEMDQMHFAWNGEIDPRSDVSYKIQGPTLIIEFACQGNGAKPLDHLHSMYRDPTQEYGRQIKVN